MKTTATLLLGLFCLLTFTSCKCDFDEDEAKNKYDNPSESEKLNKNSAEQDTIHIK
ncbi:hypothetical protein [Chryseobacterium sp. IHB B 17019]|jgi:hypothetical protein|uniref:hypothetical protein n=1 Tax=Chryseobacterium sp. IHB B 17019 TaxID=1721091 RepID=UPI000AA30091|nr:hypothetical protein [Chryseobacterium sp. IHB B 17019]